MDIFNIVDPQINYSKDKVIIFDVDGTLYDQTKLRFYMFIYINLFN